MYKTQLYFDFSRILLHKELKAGSLVRAQLLKTNKGSVNIVIGHHSFSQVITIPSTTSSLMQLTSFTPSKMSSTNSPSFTLLSSMKRPLSTKQSLSSSSSSSSSQTERVLPTVLSDTQTESNFLNLLAIVLASTSIVFIILLLIILITILLRKRHHHSTPPTSATNPYEVAPPPHQLEEIYDIPTASTDNKIYYEDLK